LRPVKLSFARRIGAIPDARWTLSTIAVFRRGTVEAALTRRAASVGSRSRRSALTGPIMRRPLGPIKLALARRIASAPRSRRAISTIAITSRWRAVEAALPRAAFSPPGD